MFNNSFLPRMGGLYNNVIDYGACRDMRVGFGGTITRNGFDTGFRVDGLGIRDRTGRSTGYGLLSSGSILSPGGLDTGIFLKRDEVLKPSRSPLEFTFKKPIVFDPPSYFLKPDLPKKKTSWDWLETYNTKKKYDIF